MQDPTRISSALLEDHEVEDMDKAIAEEKYVKNILASNNCRKAVANIATLKATALVRCELLFN